MSAGRVSTAALLAAPAAAPSARLHRHCSAEEWQAYVEKDGGNRQYRLMRLRFRRQFVERWPTLAGWYGEPLAQRVGRLHGGALQPPVVPGLLPGPRLSGLPRLGGASRRLITRGCWRSATS